MTSNGKFFLFSFLSSIGLLYINLESYLANKTTPSLISSSLVVVFLIALVYYQSHVHWQKTSSSIALNSNSLEQRNSKHWKAIIENFWLVVNCVALNLSLLSYVLDMRYNTAEVSPNQQCSTLNDRNTKLPLIFMSFVLLFPLFAMLIVIGFRNEVVWSVFAFNFCFHTLQIERGRRISDFFSKFFS